MGACGVQVGTRFLVADECRVHDVYKERLIKASDVGTMVTGKTLGDAVRSLKTPFAKKFAKLEADPAATDDQIRAFGTGSLRKAVFEGDLAGGSFLAGEVAGLITRRESAADIVNDIIGGAERLLASAPALLK
jgi:enoyl-[acyl-carrier protein] reductase II